MNVGIERWAHQDRYQHGSDPTLAFLPAVVAR